MADPSLPPPLTQSQGSVSRGEGGPQTYFCPVPNAPSIPTPTCMSPWALPSSPGPPGALPEPVLSMRPLPTHGPVWPEPTDSHVQTPGGVPCKRDHPPGHSHYLRGTVWGAWNHI